MRKSGMLEHKNGNISETRKDRGKDILLHVLSYLGAL